MHLKVSKQHVTGHTKASRKIQCLEVGTYIPVFPATIFCNPPHIIIFATCADDYFLSRRPVVNLRLAQGGVRLAATLNRIFGWLCLNFAFNQINWWNSVTVLRSFPFEDSPKQSFYCKNVISSDQFKFITVYLFQIFKEEFKESSI